MYSQIASADFSFTFRAVVGGEVFIDDPMDIDDPMFMDNTMDMGEPMNIDDSMDVDPPEFYNSVVSDQRRYAYVAPSRLHRYRA
ncbi:hypothetical protein G6F56_012520 [Rhizopus delemar]|nr:hypothetical protein G6F56_012520 [Rhizopus delemar]